MNRYFSPTSRWLLMAAVAAASCAGLSQAQPVAPTAAATCKGTLYLTFDTGSQSQAEFIAQTLRRHHIKATFFMANEKTINGDYSLDPSWGTYWKSLVADGHAFGSHTFDHVYAKRDLADGKIEMKPQFGANGGKLLSWTPQQYCDEINRVEQRFHTLTGTHLDPFWRAPGGHLTPHTLAAGQACGYAHVAWADAGFSGENLLTDGLRDHERRGSFSLRATTDAPTRLPIVFTVLRHMSSGRSTPTTSAIPSAACGPSPMAFSTINVVTRELPGTPGPAKAATVDARTIVSI